MAPSIPLPTLVTLLLVLTIIEATDELSTADLLREYRLLQARVVDLESSSRSLQSATEDGLKAATDTIWLLVCGALVMFMQAGFASLEAGAVRVNNVQSILLKNLLDVCVGTLFWWAFGFAIAYGYGDSHGFFGRGLTSWPDDGSNVPVAGEYALKDWFFQWAFSATAATIVSGGVGVAERVNSSVFDPHSIPLIVLGTFILWFGWFGFNAGSTLSMSDAATAHTAALAAVNTVLSGASGGFTLFVIRFGLLPGHKFDVAGVCNGILAGLVSITAGCSNVIPGCAIIIGAIGGVFYQCASAGIRLLKIDDPLDAFPIHGVCGIWGVLAVPFFDFAKGMSSMSFSPDVGAGYQFGIQLLGIVAIIGYVGGCSAVVFGAMRLLKIFRIDQDHELRGYDQSAHAPAAAYHMSGKRSRSPSTDDDLRPPVEGLPGVQMIAVS
ncbi:hypothetical protein FOL46_004055 [Perkinsus olseni]|uniref:Ammonium transporter AmtB-like domain-containing protein n=1 Tax=Perkinsus olseni TaxID=32597 RepID=A0A7J6M126_PEROL|nr:hypothetical protein FOL46_004055 [Perkinsus olseni]